MWWYRFARAPGCQRSLGVPDERDAQNRIEDYVDGYLPAGITRLLELTGCDEVSLFGYCFGLRHMGPLADVFGVGGLDVADALNMDGNVPPQVVLQGCGL